MFLQKEQNDKKRTIWLQTQDSSERCEPNGHNGWWEVLLFSVGLVNFLTHLRSQLVRQHWRCEDSPRNEPEQKTTKI